MVRYYDCSKDQYSSLPLPQSRGKRVVLVTTSTLPLRGSFHYYGIVTRNRQKKNELNDLSQPWHICPFCYFLLQNATSYCKKCIVIVERLHASLNQISHYCMFLQRDESSGHRISPVFFRYQTRDHTLYFSILD
jgi:hypothetical protein